MSAARLREAAALLRERAEKATPAPWKSWGMDLLSDPVGNSNVDDGIPVVRGLMPDGERLRTHNIDYIAMMAPPVALALADWLDAEYVTQAEMEPLSEVINASFTAVSGVEAGVLQFGRDPGGNIVFQANTFVGALAVADAILGTPA